MRKYFGTDGVRGVANSELTPELAFQLGRAGGYVISKHIGNSSFIVARDTRLSGQMLEAALIAGLMSVNIHVIRVGVVPTPAVAYLTRKEEACGGVMISASHNPFEDNGIKFFDHRGLKLKDEVELEIERLIDGEGDIPRYTGKHIGASVDRFDLKKEYVKFIAETVEERFDDLKIVLDCANGAASPVAYELFSQLGADVTVINNDWQGSGLTINVNCGSTHPERLQKKVVEEQADIGLAFDGDADRLIAVDHKGDIVDGDDILYVLAKSLKEKGKLKQNTVVSTVMSNFGFQKALETEDIRTVQTKVGDRYVLEEMINNGYVLGGEQSGHIVFLEYNTTGDGILSGVQLVQELQKTNKSLKELTRRFEKYPQKLVNVRVKDKNGWDKNVRIQQMIEESEERLKGNGRVLVRASGTEHLIRVMVEGKAEKTVDELVGAIAMVVEAEMSK